MPWTQAELGAITKYFPNSKEDPIGFAREFLLTIQTYEPGFSDLYQLIHMLVGERHARGWIDKVRWKDSINFC